MEEEEDDELHNNHNRRRPTCETCSRPVTVCICKHIPRKPIETKTQILILLHPHEARHKLSTTPILTRCLSNSLSLVSRHLHLSHLHPHSLTHIVYLFPFRFKQQEQEDDSLSLSLDGLAKLRPRPSLLVAFDATWRHAAEMVKAATAEGSGCLVGARRVFLEFDRGVQGGSIYDSELFLRKEPFGGCVTTMEAVARALRVLEPDGVLIEESLVGVLRELVRVQARFLKPTLPRPKLEKKKKKTVMIENVPKNMENTSD